ncbi:MULTISPECIES: hypothetical protein [unclassified Microbacterium]|uniref:hypothetical protein n=1 Tax=unclassified Microbacterium TaxID=2609290 RepID=UPI00109CB6F2|nr:MULTISPECIES: hypothetical protein [unclassified Microbacterium]
MELLLPIGIGIAILVAIGAVALLYGALAQAMRPKPGIFGKKAADAKRREDARYAREWETLTRKK